jgi:hypothetical protein
MNYDLNGATITDILEVKEGVSKAKGTPWKAIEFVCDTGEQYNNLFCFKIFQGEKNTKVDDFVSQFGTNDKVDVTFNINTNKWEKDGNVKYFVGLDVYKVSKVMAGVDNTGSAMDDSQYPPQPDEDDLPF